MLRGRTYELFKTCLGIRASRRVPGRIGWRLAARQTIRLEVVQTLPNYSAWYNDDRDLPGAGEEGTEEDGAGFGFIDISTAHHQ
jgi:hypothetical protein